MENHRTDSTPNDSYPVKSDRLLGAQPHEMSAAQKQPWLDHGLSKDQYYRWIEKFEKAIAAQGQVACNISANKMTPRKLSTFDRSGGQSIGRNVTALQSEEEQTPRASGALVL
jgi:hypothetical protein